MNYTLPFSYFHAYRGCTQLSLFEVPNKNMRIEEKLRWELLKYGSSSNTHNAGRLHPIQKIDDERELCGFSITN